MTTTSSSRSEPRSPEFPDEPNVYWQTLPDAVWAGIAVMVKASAGEAELFHSPAGKPSANAL